MGRGQTPPRTDIATLWNNWPRGRFFEKILWNIFSQNCWRQTKTKIKAVSSIVNLRFNYFKLLWSYFFLHFWIKSGKGGYLFFTLIRDFFLHFRQDGEGRASIFEFKKTKIVDLLSNILEFHTWTETHDFSECTYWRSTGVWDISEMWQNTV